MSFRTAHFRNETWPWFHDKLIERGYGKPEIQSVVVHLVAEYGPVEMENSYFGVVVAQSVVMVLMAVYIFCARARPRARFQPLSAATSE